MQGNLGAPESSDSRLTIVIPALNEEDAIGETIARCLDARAGVKETAGLAGVEVVVVSDGSTDRTAEIAQGFEEVKVVVFEQNRQPRKGASRVQGGVFSSFSVGRMPRPEPLPANIAQPWTSRFAQGLKWQTGQDVLTKNLVQIDLVVLVDEGLIIIFDNPRHVHG